MKTRHWEAVDRVDNIVLWRADDGTGTVTRIDDRAGRVLSRAEGGGYWTAPITDRGISYVAKVRTYRAARAAFLRMTGEAYV